MALRATFEILEPGAVEMKLTATMPLGAWKLIRDELHKGSFHTSKSDFADAISSMVEQAEQAFIGSKEAK